MSNLVANLALCCTKKHLLEWMMRKKTNWNWCNSCCCCCCCLPIKHLIASANILQYWTALLKLAQNYNWIGPHNWPATSTFLHLKTLFVLSECQRRTFFAFKCSGPFKSISNVALSSFVSVLSGMCPLLLSFQEHIYIHSGTNYLPLC